ncbi:Prefoldin subunit 2 [Cryptotermes secundus]|uniref:Prefoldin subunit 2 n=1 Tax=Cryptotermes secundus TaxID=105785 RepID=A0A2J7QT95_9NEOP|nr:Prefoldin subunit 2 [Cryptotermes secundus]
MTNEQIFETFQTLRKEQVRFGNKIAELEFDLHEHKIVIDTLKEVDGDRKCFNMVGGVLYERTVKEVLPILISNQEQVRYI